MIAGGGVRAVLELGGIRDVLTKSIGTNNPINQVKATMAGLKGLRKPEDVAQLRGLTIRQVLGMPRTEKAPAADEGKDSNGEAAVTAEAVVAAGSAPEQAAADAEADADQAAMKEAHDKGDPAEAHIKEDERLMGELLIRQVRSANGTSPRQRDTLRTLRLGRIGKESRREDSVHVRGLLRNVEHLVTVDDGKEGS